MVKSDVIQAVVALHPDLRQRDIELIVDTFFAEIADHLAAGGRVELRGFGAFSTRPRDARIGRNPRTGQAVNINPKRVPHFKPGKDLRNRVDEIAASAVQRQLERPAV